MKKYLVVNQKCYDLVADIYAKKDIFGGNNDLFYRPWFDMILSRFDLKNKNKVLELGAGTGQVSRKFCDWGFDSTCVEFSHNMAKHIKTISPESKVFEEDVLKLKLPSKSFDLILAMAFLHCFNLADLKILLGKVKSWLKDDGFFAVCTTLHQVSEEGFFEKKDYNNVVRFRRKWQKDELEKFLEQNGFEICETFCQSELSKPKVWISYLLKKRK